MNSTRGRHQIAEQTRPASFLSTIVSLLIFHPTHLIIVLLEITTCGLLRRASDVTFGLCTGMCYSQNSLGPGSLEKRDFVVQHELTHMQHSCLVISSSNAPQYLRVMYPHHTSRHPIDPSSRDRPTAGPS